MKSGIESKVKVKWFMGQGRSQTIATELVLQLKFFSVFPPPPNFFDHFCQNIENIKRLKTELETSGLFLFSG